MVVEQRVKALGPVQVVFSWLRRRSSVFLSHGGGVTILHSISSLTATRNSNKFLDIALGASPVAARPIRMKSSFVYVPVRADATIWRKIFTQPLIAKIDSADDGPLHAFGFRNEERIDRICKHTNYVFRKRFVIKLLQLMMKRPNFDFEFWNSGWIVAYTRISS